MRSGWMTTMLPASRGAEDLRQVGFKQRGLVRRSVLAAVSEQDDRRRGLPTDGEERAEVGVGRDHDAVILGGAVEDLVVGRGLHAEVADVDGVVTGAVELDRDCRRQRVIDEELHPASGSSRSRTASAA